MADPNTMGEAVAALNQVASAHENLQAQFIGKQNEIEQNNQAMQDWQTQLGTVDFINSDGSVRTVKTLRQLMADAQMQIDETHPHPYAMRKSTFEAIRAVNKEMFTASGFVHFGKHFNNGVVNDGLTCPSNAWSAPKENRFWLGRGLGSPSVMGQSKTAEAVVNIAGVTTHLESVGDDYNGVSRLFTVKLPPAEDGTRTFDSATGVSTKHSSAEVAFASETETNKVVTDRVDMWGLEAFLREINADDPFVYKCGLIQSKAANIDGVETETDMVRPATYFAWYEGDESSRGDGVNWLSASESERAKIARNPQNNIYFDDATGKFYQWSTRGRSFAGVGNGDWKHLDYHNPVLKFAVMNCVCPQGLTNDSLAFAGAGSSASANEVYVGDYKPYQGAHEYVGLGHFTLRNSSANDQRAINRECYFLVCGTVSRLNRGAYHPNFNPLGTAKWRDSRSGNNIINGSATWDDIIDSACIPTEKAQAFNLQPTGVNTIPCASNTSGFIAGPAGNGRVDGRYYDAIYAGGLGGVCRDMRYSAWGLTDADFSGADFAIKAGQYRGREVLLKTQFIPETVTVGGVSNYSPVNAGGTVTFPVSSSDNPIERDSKVFESLSSTHWILVGDNGNSMLIKRASTATDLIRWPYSDSYAYLYGSGDIAAEFDAKFPVGTKLWLGAMYPINISISGEYVHTDVIGEPVEILLCDSLKDGWLGGWSQAIPDGTLKNFEFNKPITGNISRIFTLDSGGNWTDSGISENLTTNSYYTSVTRNHVGLYSYVTKASVTKNAKNINIIGGKEGLGCVYASSDGYDISGGRGRLLRYSLTGKVAGTDIFRKGAVQNLFLSNCGLALGPYLITNDREAYANKHDEIVIDGGGGISAFKALDYKAAENKQAFIHYAYTELYYDTSAGDWGDDSKIHIADNQTTMLDENGHKVKVGTARCVEPLGWIKNEK
ncbi:hypothetical protein [Pseudoalteromonas galatheae]|uniref:hypothetical protein n=1 Tax=Pseudoalteromonas galatheae TaxID=579562 RepID=UPI0030D0E6AE